MHIHHKDFIKLNDRPSNLIQITREEHAAIHGVRYDIKGGSSRMKGRKHSEATKAKMRKAALGSKKSFYMRSVEDREMRRKWCRFKHAGVKKDISIEDINYFCRKGLSQRQIAKIFNCSRTVIANRLKWTIISSKTA